MNLVPNFKNTLFNDNVKDIALDFSEMGIDAAINNDILAEVPIAKSIVAFCKTGVAIRDRNLLKQTLRFIDKKWKILNLQKKSLAGLFIYWIVILILLSLVY